MRRWLVTAALCLASSAALAQGSDLAAADDPGAGAVAGGVYRNAYFGLDYPLPPGWRAAAEGPAPSATGYYVLGNFVPEGDRDATLLIAAQDLFFAAPPVADAAEMTRRIDAAMRATAGMVIDRAPVERVIAGRRFSELDFSGVGLYRAMVVTELRCHLISFTFTATESARRAQLVASLDRLALAPDEDANAPICLKDYGSGDNLLHRGESAPVGPYFVPVPVRLVIGSDGRAERIHVIRATPAQQAAIAAALVQWRFKPLNSNGEVRPVETGILFSFKPARAAAP